LEKTSGSGKMNGKHTFKVVFIATFNEYVAIEWSVLDGFAGVNYLLTIRCNGFCNFSAADF
jgi:hypothetical protein